MLPANSRLLQCINAPLGTKRAFAAMHKFNPYFRCGGAYRPHSAQGLSQHQIAKMTGAGQSQRDKRGVGRLFPRRAVLLSSDADGSESVENLVASYFRPVGPGRDPSYGNGFRADKAPGPDRV